MISCFQRCVARLLIVCLAGLAMPVHAGVLPTESALSQTVPSQGERAQVASFFERAEVRAQLEAYGVNPADVQERVAAMTDEEVQQLASRIDALPAGGDFLGFVLAVFIILLITDILGFTKIFPFTRPVR